MPFGFHAYPRRIINQQIDAKAWWVLGAAGLHFAVVALLVDDAIKRNAVKPEQLADVPGATVGRGVYPDFPAVVATMLGQLPGRPAAVARHPAAGPSRHGEEFRGESRGRSG